MKKIIFLTNTYFQIIVAINLKLTKFINDECDIIISDHSKDSYKIYERLKELDLFKKTFYVKNYKQSRSDLTLNFLFKKRILKSIFGKICDKYDEFFFYNITQETYQIFDYLKSLNKNIMPIRFEEGYIEYLKYNDCTTANYKRIRKIFKRKNFEEILKDIYVFYPNLMLYKFDGNINKIDIIDKNNLKLMDTLNIVFDYEKLEDNYNRKYIFFEESFFADNFNIDDLELILKISEIVGKENLFVKLHPRNKIDRFSKYGILTNRNVAIPWELIQMNNDFTNTVFLTISSGSVLASKLYFNENIKTFLLYNCTKLKSKMVTEEYIEYIKSLRNKFGFNSFIIPKNKIEFIKMLNE